MKVSRVLLVMATCLVWLSGCETTNLSDAFRSNDTAATTADPAVEPEATGSITVPGGEAAASATPGLLGGDPNDDLSMGKQHYRQENFGQAEHYFRLAVETHPKDGEAWLGLAASYDRLRRFDLADRAYGQAIKIVGPTAEVLNNQGYSYMLRGDYRRAREKLTAAQVQAPDNPYINNNLVLLNQSAAKGKAIQ
jgi:Flp pilus assembly protein TadD